MNEKLQYAEMLEIPVSTCSITYKQSKKKAKPVQKKLSGDAVKQELINKVNETSEEPVNSVSVNPFEEDLAPKQTSFTVKKAEKKGRFPQIKLNVIGVQLIIIGVLVATIFLTSALVPNSGINVFMKNVFGGGAEQTAEDLRPYSEFEATLPVNASENVMTEEGVTTFSSSGSLYSPCDGKIKAITLDEETNKYTIEIMHSENFITVFSGVDYAYSEVGESVFSNIPVGYINENATMCFYDGEGEMITGYTLDGNSIVWSV